MSAPIYPLTVFYDASCQLCSSEMRNLMLRNQAGLLHFVDCSPASFVSPLDGVDRGEMMNCIHAQQADGTVISGVEVFRRSYEAVGLGWVTAISKWPLVGALADKAYPVLVRNRYRIPAWVTHALFEGPTRRAAEKAAARRCDTGGVCELKG